jgi:hypothetical protein
MRHYVSDVGLAIVRAENGTADNYDAFVLMKEVLRLTIDVKMYKELLGLHETTV